MSAEWVIVGRGYAREDVMDEEQRAHEAPEREEDRRAERRDYAAHNLLKEPELNRDELWRMAEIASRLGNRSVLVDLQTYRKLVAAYDYWLSRLSAAQTEMLKVTPTGAHQGTVLDVEPAGEGWKRIRVDVGHGDVVVLVVPLEYTVPRPGMTIIWTVETLQNENGAMFRGLSDRLNDLTLLMVTLFGNPDVNHIEAPDEWHAALRRLRQDIGK